MATIEAENSPSQEERQKNSTGANQQTGSDKPASTKKSKPRLKSPSVESISQLLSEVYAGNFKRLTLKGSELKAIRSALPPSAQDQEELLGLARQDWSLEKTRQLLLIDIRLDGLVGQIRNFARDVLQGHPAFQADALSGVLQNLPEAAPELDAILSLASQDYAALPWADEAKPNSKKDLEQYKTNAVHCLLLVYRWTRGTSIERLHRYLQRALWLPAAQSGDSQVELLVKLLTSRDPAASAVTFQLLENEATTQRELAENARRNELRAREQSAELEQRLVGLERALDEAQAETAQLRRELEHSKSNHEVNKAHWQDDYEQLRGRVQRCLKDELSLLDEGLHALRREPPKVHVMIDHAERAIDGLKQEMDRLKGNS